MCLVCEAQNFSYAASTEAGAARAATPVYGATGSNTWASQGAASDLNTNGVLSGDRWASLSLTYSFPTLASQYDPGYPEAQNNFSVATAALQTATRYAFSLISQYTNMTFTEVSGSTAADIRSAFSDSAAPTAYAYYPGNYTEAGDVWYSSTYPDYANPVLAQYGMATVMHELGHALGLKHGHETGGPGNTAMDTAHDQMAYSIMTYRSYQGAALTGYTNELNGYAQTYMMYDIAALQKMYGANFNTNSGNTVYTWSSTTGTMSINGVSQSAPGGNRIFMTLWDGNGIDTYDLSNYTTNLSIDLTPGSYSLFSAVQQADLGDGHFAPGNVYNALQYNGDVKSLIENANGGSGNDTITGNSAANTLNGNGGNDTLSGGNGSDALSGGNGTDTLTGGSGFDSAQFSALSNASTWVRGATGNYTVTAGALGADTLTGMEYLKFTDRAVALWKSTGQDLIGDFNGDGKEDVFLRSSFGDNLGWQMNNTATPTNVSFGFTDFNWSARAVADFNGDGKDDILWRHTNGTVSIWLMNGTPTTAGSPGVVDNAWDIKATGDFNGDGKADILWQHTSGTLAIWGMNGTSAAESHGLGAVDSSWVVQGAGDFNGDGTSDILFRNTNGTVAIWFMGSGLVVSSQGAGYSDANWSIRGIGDFNGDGKDDILWRNVDGTIAEWTMNGAAVTSASSYGNPGNAWEIQGVGDLNGDGKADIMFRNLNTGDAASWYVNGSTTSGSQGYGVQSQDWFIL